MMLAGDEGTPGAMAAKFWALEKNLGTTQDEKSSNGKKSLRGEGL